MKLANAYYAKGPQHSTTIYIKNVDGCWMKTNNNHVRGYYSVPQKVEHIPDFENDEDWKPIKS